MINDKQQRLKKCFSAVFPRLSEREIDSASLESVVEWDSVATVTLLSVIEEEFGIEVEPTAFDQLVSFRAILNYLQELPAAP